MRVLSGRSRFARTLAAATAVVITATTGIFVGVGIANAAATDNNAQNPVLRAIAVKTDTAQTNYTSTAWTTVTQQYPIISTTGVNNVLVRFTAQSKCQAGTTDGWCTIRILVNGTEASPADGTNFVWQWQGFNETWGSRSMERYTSFWTGCCITITVQAAVRGGATSFRLQDWTLTTELF